MTEIFLALDAKCFADLEGFVRPDLTEERGHSPCPSTGGRRALASDRFSEAQSGWTYPKLSVHFWRPRNRRPPGRIRWGLKWRCRSWAVDKRLPAVHRQPPHPLIVDVEWRPHPRHQSGYHSSTRSTWTQKDDTARAGL